MYSANQVQYADSPVGDLTVVLDLHAIPGGMSGQNTSSWYPYLKQLLSCLNLSPASKAFDAGFFYS